MNNLNNKFSKFLLILILPLFAFKIYSSEEKKRTQAEENLELPPSKRHRFSADLDNNNSKKEKDSESLSQKNKALILSEDLINWDLYYKFEIPDFGKIKKILFSNNNKSSLMSIETLKNTVIFDFITKQLVASFGNTHSSYMDSTIENTKQQHFDFNWGISLKDSSIRDGFMVTASNIPLGLITATSNHVLYANLYHVLVFHRNGKNKLERQICLNSNFEKRQDAYNEEFDTLFSLATTSDSQTVAISGMYDGECFLKIFDKAKEASDLAVNIALNNIVKEYVYALSFSPDGNYLAIGCHDIFYILKRR